jgi:hypothetical protein
VVPQRMGSDHPSVAPYGTVFTTRDGESMVLAVGTNKQFQSLCDVLGVPENGAFFKVLPFSRPAPEPCHRIATSLTTLATNSNCPLPTALHHRLAPPPL